MAFWTASWAEVAAAEACDALSAARSTISSKYARWLSNWLVRRWVYSTLMFSSFSRGTASVQSGGSRALLTSVPGSSTSLPSVLLWMMRCT